MESAPNNHKENLQKAERIAYLIEGHLKGTLTPEEGEELDDWITESDENLELFEKLTDEDNIEIAMQQYLQAEKEKVEALAGVKNQIRHQGSIIKKIWPYFIAASIILTVVSFYLFKPDNKGKNIEKPIAQNTGNTNVNAGSDKAVLTLSDGRAIILDSTNTGLLANEGNISIKKGVKGEIVYDGTDNAMQSNYNTIAVPRGGQYSIMLEDGTKVWLNAESFMKFPAGFAASTREVELKGEAYFEVAKNPDRPFKVKIISPYGEAGSVEVLGTQFNINSYGDEGVVKTTLVEGSVRVEKDGKSKILSPGEQALMANDITVVKANVNEATAWKEGKFLFRDATVRSIGEQIKRWYDVDVAYQGDISQHFNMEASRDIPLAKLLNGLEGTAQVQFNLEGKKLIIKPKKAQ